MRIPVMLRCLALAALPVIACSSSSPNTGGTGGSGGGGGGGGSGGGGGDSGRGVLPPPPPPSVKNPYGVPYPTDNIGIIARGGTSATSTPGNVIQNFAFLGYFNADQGTLTVDTGSPTIISLADFYDPAMKKYKVLHLNVAARWCSPCNDEADALTCQGPNMPASSGSYCSGATGVTAKELATDGAAIFSLLTEGTSEGTGSTVSDLKIWVTGKSIDYNMGIDPEQQNLGVFFNAAAIPWNADIDTRTMELLDQGEGYDGMLQQDIENWVTWVDNNKPSYPCPTGYSLSGNKCVEGS
jgi:hypothetical protein